MLAPECAPVAKVGGLGDVVFGLSRELEIRGHSVEIILPKYDCLRYDQIYDLRLSYKDLWVPWYEQSVHCSVYFGFVHGRKCFFIEPHSDHNFFNRRVFYGQGDDDQRFAFFCRAALEFMLRSNKHPDIIHCHDWQTGLTPVLLYEMYKHLGMTHPRVCYTLHNLQHQGVTGERILRATGLNRHPYFFHQDRLQDNFNPSAINMMKGGIVYSNFVNTVSPKYAWEVTHGTQNYGLGHTLHVHQNKFGGILNGVDYDTWNPESDRHIPRQYGIESLDQKYENKKALRQRFWLEDSLKPIICYVGRLDHQKGVPLITHAIHYTLQKGCQFVLLGTSPDGRIAQHFWGLKRYHNDNPNCHLELSFNEELSQTTPTGRITSATATPSTTLTPQALSPRCTAPLACGIPIPSTSASSWSTACATIFPGTIRVTTTLGFTTIFARSSKVPKLAELLLVSAEPGYVFSPSRSGARRLRRFAGRMSERHQKTRKP